MNPKDSTRTRLVLDTHRLVLDSYSKNLDSIQQYLSLPSYAYAIWKKLFFLKMKNKNI